MPRTKTTKPSSSAYRDRPTFRGPNFTYLEGETLLRRNIGAQYFGFRFGGFLIFPISDDDNETRFSISFASEYERDKFIKAQGVK